MAKKWFKKSMKDFFGQLEGKWSVKTRQTATALIREC